MTLARAGHSLILDATLRIHDGWRVGLVGANGSGKSSLLAMLRGDLHPDSGDCRVPNSWRIASVAQETPALQREALDFVLDGDLELRAIERAIEIAHDADEGTAIAELHARLHAIDGYAAAARAAALLAGLGFTAGDLSRPVADFSGGWRMRLNLGRALASRADLLLLDEPTNHLDLDAIVWFERWLAEYRGTLLIVSHDRDVLDACTTHTAGIEAGRLSLYTGNYSAYEAQRAARLAAQQSLHEKQQREIAQMTRFIERFRAKATKARQAQSRLKALQRMERVSAAHVDAPFDFQFAVPERSPDPLLVLDDVDAGYDGQPVLRDIRLSLRSGARIGLLGPNGAGKSTLTKLLAGDLAPAAGRRIEGHGLRIGYFAQHQLEQLRLEESPLEHLSRQEPEARELELRNYLGSFDFRGEMAESAVGPFSGGEKSRLALALLVRRRPNLLLLDEPTNHLDLEMRHALTRALTGYQGSLVLVSHDRTLLRTTCDQFVLVADGQAGEFDGDVDDYLQWLTSRRQAAARGNDSPARPDAREARMLDRAERDAQRRDLLSRRRPLIKETDQLERRIANLEAEKEDLDAALSDPALYVNGGTAGIAETTRRRREITRELSLAEDRWLLVQAELEELAES